MLHGIHCTPSCCIKSTAFNRVPFLHTAGNTMHSIGMHFNTLHGLHCCIMDYTAAIMLHIIHCIQSGWVASELQLQDFATASATRDLSHVCDPHRSSWATLDPSPTE